MKLNCHKVNSVDIIVQMGVFIGIHMTKIVMDVSIVHIMILITIQGNDRAAYHIKTSLLY